MSKHIRKVSTYPDKIRFGKHRFEHWYVDNQVYFITARCRDRVPAFASREARDVFWDRLDHYAGQQQFVPWVVSMMDTHYHILGYNRCGSALQTMMQRLHGSVAKLVNDVLESQGFARLGDFWRDTRGREFFDGCIRDEKQCRLAYRYTLTQCKRHGICENPVDYPDTRVMIELDRGVKRAHELGAFMEGVPYPRYFRE